MHGGLFDLNPVFDRTNSKQPSTLLSPYRDFRLDLHPHTIAAIAFGINAINPPIANSRTSGFVSPLLCRTSKSSSYACHITISSLRVACSSVALEWKHLSATPPPHRLNLAGAFFFPYQPTSASTILKLRIHFPCAQSSDVQPLCEKDVITSLLPFAHSLALLHFLHCHTLHVHSDAHTLPESIPIPSTLPPKHAWTRLQDPMAQGVPSQSLCFTQKMLPGPATRAPRSDMLLWSYFIRAYYSMFWDI